MDFNLWSSGVNVMYICNRCKTKLSPYTKKCPVCKARNINYNDFKVLVFIFGAGGIIGLLLDNAMSPGYIKDIQRVVYIVALVSVAYFYAQYNEFREGKVKRIIQMMGSSLLKERESFSIEELSVECGWMLNGSKDSEIIKKWIADVATEEGWQMNDNKFYRLDNTKLKTKIE